MATPLTQFTLLMDTSTGSKTIGFATDANLDFQKETKTYRTFSTAWEEAVFTGFKSFKVDINGLVFKNSDSSTSDMDYAKILTTMLNTDASVGFSGKPNDASGTGNTYLQGFGLPTSLKTSWKNGEIQTYSLSIAGSGALTIKTT